MSIFSVVTETYFYNKIESTSGKDSRYCACEI